MSTKLLLQDGALIAHRQNDVEPVLASIKQKQDARAWDNADGSVRHVARVDKVLFNDLCNRRGVTWNQAMLDEDLFDSLMLQYLAEYPAFKVAPGRNL